ncbi:universal stress protein [Planococcus shenhongbingii]|uniref:Universal stress protein n=1 Tax=Planococcus shenhongbingii TaxID=3058398 RepID=A0ABT8NH24_9BACL|nr:universal stress protein [Planococcus sp. N017]MDN7247187.1 universal stress protein [Planococcus sp. N017]
MTFEYKNILAAVDGSNEAKRAFETSVGIAKRNNAILNLIYVVDTRSYTAMTKRVPSIDDRVFTHGRELLDNYKKEAQAAGLPEVNIIVAPGSPHKVISREYAKRVNADLIVCGAQGMNAVEHFLMGSVSEHIVRSSPCDVLVVRRSESEKAEDQQRADLK